MSGVATSARELLALARELAEQTTQPTVEDREAAITALGRAGRTLHRLAFLEAKPSAAVEQLADACRSAAAGWPARPGRLPDLVGAACDLLGRAEYEASSDARWVAVVAVTQTARGCVELALRDDRYARVPALRWVHAAAVTVEREAARQPPALLDGGLLDTPVPHAERDHAGPEAVRNALARLQQALKRDTYSAPLPVTAALATAAAAEQIARGCAQVAADRDSTSRGAWRQAPASWQVIQLALVRFEDGSRRRGTPPHASVHAALRLHRAWTRALPEIIEADAGAATLQGAAHQLPLLAHRLDAAMLRWRRELNLFAKARDLTRREELVSAILSNSAVRINEVDLVPVAKAIRVAERLSTALAIALDPLSRDRYVRRRTTADRALDADAHWAARLVTHADHVVSPPALAV